MFLLCLLLSLFPEVHLATDLQSVQEQAVLGSRGFLWVAESQQFEVGVFVLGPLSSLGKVLCPDTPQVLRELPKTLPEVLLSTVFLGILTDYPETVHLSQDVLRDP